MAILDQSGIRIQKLSGILQELQDIARRKFADVIEPTDLLDVSESSVLGRILGILAEPEASNEELLLQLWQSLDLNQAEGIFLEKIVGLLGIIRKPESRGYTGLMLHGRIGATVPAKSIVASKVTGDSFETTSDITFKESDANGVVLKINSIAPDSEYSLRYTSSYGANTYPVIKVKAVDGDTKEMVAKRFMETLNYNSENLVATVDLDDNVVVRWKNMNSVGNFYTETPYMVVSESFMPISGIAITNDAVRQSADTIDIIQTSVIGWLGVTNPFDSIASEPAESDKSLRNRAKNSKSIKSTSNRISLYSDLFELNSVRFVNIKENIYDNQTGNGVASKGIAVVVLGGDDDEIAEAIRENKPLGCATSGTIEKVLVDVAGSTTIRFSRPEFVPIEITLSILAEPTFPQNGKVLIQEAIVRYFDTLEVGDSVIWSKLFNPINEVAGQSVRSLLIGRKGETLSTNNIDLIYNQMPVISFEDINI